MSSSRHVSHAAQEAEAAMRDIQSRLEGNQHCADCGFPRPDFVNLTRGTFICDKCTDVHRMAGNPRIKDLFGGKLTTDDVRRMNAVGNDMANRKFLATWDAREVPPPDRHDPDALREFLWLKYEGSFKGAPRSSVRSQAALNFPRDERPSYYDVDRARDRDRDRPHSPDRDPSYRREHEIFHDVPQHPDRPRSYWSSRFSQNQSRVTSPPQGAAPRRDEYYRLSEPPPLTSGLRYRTLAPTERFQPPQPPPPPPGAHRSSRPRYQEEYEDYASQSSRDRNLRRLSGSHRGDDGRSGSFGYSDEEVDPEYERRTAQSKRKGSVRSRRRAASRDEDERGSYYDSEEEEEPEPQREHRVRKKKSSKDSKSRHKTEEEMDDEVYENDSVEDDRDFRRASNDSKKKKGRRGSKSDRNGERDADSIQTATAEDLEAGAEATQAAGPNAKPDFDLISEWMGDSKGTDGSQGVPASGAVPPNLAGGVPPSMHQAYQTVQMPLIPNPMSMYNSVMPMPGGGFMPVMMPSVVPGMMPGMNPGVGLPGMPPPGMHPGVPSTMLGAQPVLGGGVPVSGMPGMVNGMANLGMNQMPNAAAATAGQAEFAAAPGASHLSPPPPPPLGMPAGPPPGPPPEPPQ